MHSQRHRVVVVLAVLVLWASLTALPAWANKTISTSDGVTLTLTDAGAFSSLTVDGNTVPTLSGVTGGFFIVPVESLPGDHRVDFLHQTYYAGTPVTGTATHVGNDLHLTTGTIENHTFDIWIRGGLPYLKFEGTVHRHDRHGQRLLDGLPDAGGRQRLDLGEPARGTPDSPNGVRAPIPSVQTIDTSSNANWYFARTTVVYAGRHSWQSINPYGSITRNGSGSGTANMGLSLSPMLYPPQAYMIEYNAQTGFFIEFEMGTTTKTTRNPNAAKFNFVVLSGTLPRGGCARRCSASSPSSRTGGTAPSRGGTGVLTFPPTPANNCSNPQDYRIKFEEGRVWTSSDPTYYSQGPILTMRYAEPWAWHTEFTDVPTFEQKAKDIPANTGPHPYPNCCCANGNPSGLCDRDVAQLQLLSGVMNPDGTYAGSKGPERVDPAFDDSGMYRGRSPTRTRRFPTSAISRPGATGPRSPKDFESRRRNRGTDLPNPPGADIRPAPIWIPRAGFGPAGTSPTTSTPITGLPMITARACTGIRTTTRVSALRQRSGLHVGAHEQHQVHEVLLRADAPGRTPGDREHLPWTGKRRSISPSWMFADRRPSSHCGRPSEPGPRADACDLRA